MRCHACGRDAELASGERVGFRDSCESCHVDLHVCLNCAHYDAGAYNECREPNAERVADRERGNRCDYFAAGDSRAGDPKKGSAENARAQLEGLFKK